MPRTMRTASAPSQELKHFTNREDERQVLCRLLELPPGQPLPVVMFFGVGGTGKSWLLRKLRMELPANLPSALLDFEPLVGGTPYHNDLSRALAELRRQFGAVECPCFDIAYGWLRFKEGIKDEPLLKGNGLAATTAEVVGELASGVAAGIPLFGLFLKKVAATIGKAFKGSRLERWFAERTNQEDFLRLRRMEPQEIYPLLVDRLLLDLAEGLPERAGRACRGLVFIDTVETLRTGQLSEAQVHLREQWLRDMHRVDSPVLLVLAGRDRLSWEAHDPAYCERRYLEQHLIGGLSEHDSRIFLWNCGVIDASLQDAVLRVSLDTETAATGGAAAYHPFSLGLCADTLRNAPNTNPDAFDMVPGDVTRLAIRFLKSLPSPAYEVWVQRLALTPRFDETAARAAFSSSHDVHQDAAWQQLRGLSFIRETDRHGWWSLHVRMRQALAEAFANVAAGNHRFWNDHWMNRVQCSTDDFASLAWYHRYCLSPDDGRKEWNALAESLREARHMTEHHQLLNWWDPTGMETSQVDSTERSANLVSLADELYAATKGRCAENLQRAIACYEAAQRVYTEKDFPADWARTQNNLGVAYKDLPGGDRAENLQRAIACYEAAQRVYTEENFPAAWAKTQHNLGIAYTDLPGGDRAANLRKAIACFEAAQRVYTEEDFPADWAMTQNNLGIAYQELPWGDRAENIRKAIACYEAALHVRTEEDFPFDWAWTQNCLGAAYGDLPGGDRAANLRKAIACYEAAQRVYTEEDFPADWACTQNNLGLAYKDLPGGDRAANLRKAIACYEAAQRVYTEEDFPADWAMTQHNLGLAYKDLPGGDRAANLRKAIACYEAAQRVYTEEDFPADWACTQNNLGVAYKDLPGGDRAENLQRAIACYEAAQRVYTEENFPAAWAKTQHNLNRAKETLRNLK